MNVANDVSLAVVCVACRSVWLRHPLTPDLLCGGDNVVLRG
jgi:hypothetical protein